MLVLVDREVFGNKMRSQRFKKIIKIYDEVVRDGCWKWDIEESLKLLRF